MGSVLYNFLSESIFFHKPSIDSSFSNETEESLVNALMNYREFVINNIETLHSEISLQKSSLKIFSSRKTPPIKLLTQTALYLDQFVISDPLFELTEPRRTAAEPLNLIKRLENNRIHRTQLTDNAKFLVCLAPMVAADYVKVFPLNYYFERPIVPFYYPKDGFNNVLPHDIITFFRENAIISAVKKGDNGSLLIYPGRNLELGRIINVGFKDANFDDGELFVLHKVLAETTSAGEKILSLALTDDLPTENEFVSWVNQSINQASKKLYDQIFTEIALASNLNCTYLADSLFASKLIDQSIGVTDSIQQYATNTIINLDLPFIDRISSKDLMDIRIEHSDTFLNFRIELEKQFRELRTITDEKTLKIKTQNVFHELNEVQGQKIKNKISQYKSSRNLNTAIGMASLAMSFQSGGLSMLGLAIAAGKHYKDYQTYQNSLKEIPGYFLWKIQNAK